MAPEPSSFSMRNGPSCSPTRMAVAPDELARKIATSRLCPMRIVMRLTDSDCRCCQRGRMSLRQRQPAPPLGHPPLASSDNQVTNPSQYQCHTRVDGDPKYEPALMILARVLQLRRQQAGTIPVTRHGQSEAEIVAPAKQHHWAEQRSD